MNNAQMNAYMQLLAEKYSNANDSHMRVIRNYINNLLTHDEYKRLDELKTLELNTIKSLIDSFLYFKNQSSL